MKAWRMSRLWLYPAILTVLYKGCGSPCACTWYFIVFVNITKVTPTSRLLSRIVLCQLAQLR